MKYPFLWEVRCYLWRASLRLNVNFLCGGRPVHRQSRQCKLKRNKHMIILEGNYHTRWIVALEHLGLLCFSGCNKQKHPHILMSSPVQHMVAFRAPGRSLLPSPDPDGDPVLNSSKKWNAHICLLFFNFNWNSLCPEALSETHTINRVGIGPSDPHGSFSTWDTLQLYDYRCAEEQPLCNPTHFRYIPRIFKNIPPYTKKCSS